MKNGKRNGIGVSEPSLQSTVHSRQLGKAGEKGGASRSRQSSSRQGTERGGRVSRAKRNRREVAVEAGRGCGGAAAAAGGDRPHRVYAPFATQPPGRKAQAAVFDSVAGAEYQPFHMPDARSGSAAGRARRCAAGGTEQARPCGGGALARRGSRRACAGQSGGTGTRGGAG